MSRAVGWQRATLLALVAAAGIATAVLPAMAAADRGEGNGGPTTTCTGVFSGYAFDLVVPAGATCLVSGAMIKHDVIVQPDASLAIERSNVGHDISATRPQNVETGFGASLTPGPVYVGHDVEIVGSDAPNAVGYDVCDTTIGHDLEVDRTAAQFEINVGDVGPQPDEFCTYARSGPNHVGHDLVVSGNSANSIDVGNNTVGHRLIVLGNTARTYIDVSDNQVREDAICGRNAPPPTKDGPEDGPNQAGHNDGCG